jgi:hypothetical protein
MIGSRFKKMTLEEIKQSIITINDDLLSASDFAALSDYDLNEDEVLLGNLNNNY